MTDIPDWVIRIPNADIHTLPSTGPVGGQNAPSTTLLRDAINAMFPQFVRWFFAQLGLSFGGVDTGPAWNPLDWLTDWAQGAAEALGLPASSSLALPLDVDALWTNIVENLVPDSAVFGGSSTQGNAITDALSQAWSGVESLADTATADAKAIMDSMFSQVLAHTRQIQELQTQSISGRLSGQRFEVDFSDYPDGPMPAGWTVTYSGSGTSTVGIKDGKACWNSLVNDAARSAFVMFDTPTDTDYQVVRGTMSRPPDQAGSGGVPRVWSVIRADSATPSTFVWARAYSPAWLVFRGDIGCTVAGVEHVWASNFPLTWSLDIAVVAGVGASDRMFEVYSGNSLVYRYTDSAAQSVMDASHRHWGARTEMKTDLFGAKTPGEIAGTSAADNKPPELVGPTAKMYRTSATTVAFNNGWNTLPNNFFQVVLRCSDDITATTTAGTEPAGSFTVSRDGSYCVKVSIRLGTAMATLTKLGLRVNGSLEYVEVTGYPSATTGLTMSAVFPDVYLLAGDVIDLQTWHAGVSGNYIQAEATGMETMFSITAANLSYL